MKKKSILLIFAGLTLGISGTLAATSSFPDVSTSHWAYPAVEWAKSMGYVNGYTDGTFGGDKNLSRYEMVQILSKYDDANKQYLVFLEKNIKDLSDQVSELSQNDGTLNIEDKLTEANIDLNGDGKEDQIKMTLVKDQDNSPSGFELTINGQKVSETYGWLQGYFRIVDIDKSDKYKEIMVGKLGTDAMRSTLFYMYDGNQIKLIGETESVYRIDYNNVKLMNFPGDGTFTAQTNGSILHTWFYDGEYGLDVNHMVKAIAKELYPMNTKVTLLKDLPLQTSRDNDAIITTLKKGETASLIWTDDKQWVQARNSQGVDGWFKVDSYDVIIENEKFYGAEVFDGLTIAG